MDDVQRVKDYMVEGQRWGAISCGCGDFPGPDGSHAESCARAAFKRIVIQRDTLLAVVKQLCHAEDDGKGYRTWWDNARAAIAEVEGE